MMDRFTAIQDGIRRSTVSAGSDWNDTVDRTIAFVASQKPVFNANDIWYVLDELGIESPPTRSAMGGAFQRAKKALVAEPMGHFVQSERREQHSVVQQWKSLLYRGI